MKLSEELQWRGFVNQTTYPDLSILDGDPITFYWGVDPSADSMQAGNFSIAMMIKHFVKHGHKPVLLVGGATGMVGDPDGKDDERNLQSIETIEKNKQSISDQYRNIFGDVEFLIVDNYDWFKDFSYLEFLRSVGKNVPMSQMLGREFVQSRLGEGGAGISYAEFSYALIQGYDFVHLFKNHGVTLQVCGSDQWGNCIAGVELIRRMEGGEAHIWSAPLVMNKTTGKKFGKTEDGAVWLDPAKTSPYKFYQFWLNAGDDDVEDYLKIYTLLDKQSLDDIVVKFSDDKSARLAQKTLAYEVTKLVHSQYQADKQKRIAEALFGSRGLPELTGEELDVVRAEISSAKAAVGDSIFDVLLETGLVSSKTEARQLIKSGAVYINGAQSVSEKIGSADMIDGKFLLRKGKSFSNSALIELK